MAGRFSIDVVFRAINQVTQPIRNMTRSTSKFTRSVRRDFAKAQRSVKNFTRSIKTGMSRAIKGAAIGALMLLSVAIGATAQQLVEFDQSLTQATAKFGGIQRGTAEFNELAAAARKVGSTTEFTATQAALGLENLAQAGYTAKQAIAALPIVTDLATAASLEFHEATEISVKSLNALGLASKDPIQQAENLTRVTNVLAKASTTSAADIQGMFESIRKGGKVITNAGQSIDTFATLTAKMIDNALTGEMAGTQLRNIMIKMIDPTAAAKNALGKLGVELFDQNGQYRDLIDVIGDFEKATAGITPQQRDQAAATIFGDRNLAGFNILLSEGADSLKEYRGMLETSTTAAHDMAEDMRKSLGNRIKVLKSAALELGFKFIEAFQERGGDAIGRLTEWINNFDMQPIINGVERGIQLFSDLFTILRPFLPLIFTIVGAMKAYKAVMFAIALVQKIASLTNPFGWIALAIVAIALLVKNWDSVKDAIGRTWELLKEFGANVIDFIFGGIIGVVKEVWEGIKEIGEGLKGLFSKGLISGSDDEAEAARERGMSAANMNPRRVITPSERISRSYSESTNRSEITVRNDGTSNVDTDSGIVAPGQRIRLQPSG